MSKDDKSPDDRWYENDPMAQGNGLGLVLHEKSGRWVVSSVLRDSPGERAGVKAGDVVVQVHDYVLKDGDSMELMHLIRSGFDRKTYDLLLDRSKEGEVTVPVAPTAMMLIMSTHGRLNGGFGFGDVCRSCKLCLPVFGGFVTCGTNPDPITGKRCSSPCMIA